VFSVGIRSPIHDVSWTHVPTWTSTCSIILISSFIIIAFHFIFITSQAKKLINKRTATFICCDTVFWRSYFQKPLMIFMSVCSCSLLFHCMPLHYALMSSHSHCNLHTTHEHCTPLIAHIVHGSIQLGHFPQSASVHNTFIQVVSLWKYVVSSVDWATWK
jgi:hypothetical protein